MRISGSTVLLTGATGGIGRAIAKALADRGANLIVTGRRGDLLEDLVARYGGRSLAVDLAVADDVDRLVQEAGDVDILVANAALPASGALESFTPSEIDRALDVNLRAPMVLSRQLAPRMAARGRGHLLFVSSILGKMPQAYGSVYSATKFGLRGFGGSLRADLRGTGVGVSVVFPGIIREAGMFADANVKPPKGLRTNSPDDVARGVAVAIEKNSGEVVVAPLPMRLMAGLGAVAPGVITALAQRMGANDMVVELAAGQRPKR
ncbi:SDR family NAD(P)-dependent oxidoreductase [Mycolicibacterium moriokaense]|nr:SDR family NAD(P)-dependent oxidoreductase [Mycolicibacterium moriokaense]